MSECDGHSHDHGDDNDLGLSLRPHIDFQRTVCYNEEFAGAGKDVLKLHENRLSAEPALISPDDDPELLLIIPFTEAVTVRSLSIRSVGYSNEYDAPKVVKLFTNREDLDFNLARELPPSATLDLISPDHFPDGTIDYPLRPAGRFQNINCIALFFEENFGGPDCGTCITYVGLKGKGTKMKRFVVDAVYETKGMPEDHKTPGDKYSARNIL